jgi:flagellar biogenesis protein FliO
MDAVRASGVLAVSLEGPAMDRRLPARPRILVLRCICVAGAMSLCAMAAAKDPEARVVPFEPNAPAAVTGDAWIPLMVCMVAAVVAVAALVKRARRLNNRPSSGIQVMDRAQMGRGRSLSLVRVGDRVVLVGESAQGFQRLAEFGADSPEAPAALRRIAS